LPMGRDMYQEAILRHAVPLWKDLSDEERKAWSEIISAYNSPKFFISRKPMGI
jgi:hypothetical protein